jgi:zinc transporter ZupT
LRSCASELCSARLAFSPVHRQIESVRLRFIAAKVALLYLDRLTSSTLLVLGLVTLAAIAGAVAGVVAASAGLWVRHLLPFSAGLLLGMSLLMMAPEAFAAGATAQAGTGFVLGFVTLAAAETALHRTRPDPHQTWAGVIPVAAAISIHSVLDGWNTVVALTVGSAGALAFAGAMALHKLTGGFAVGAVIRAAVPGRRGAVALAAAIESATLLGAWLFAALPGSSGQTWTLWLLAATAGSLLYLGLHTWRRSLAGSSRAVALTGTAAGLFTIWLISLVAQ